MGVNNLPRVVTW